MEGLGSYLEEDLGLFQEVAPFLVGVDSYQEEVPLEALGFEGDHEVVLEAFGPFLVVVPYY